MQMQGCSGVTTVCTSRVAERSFVEMVFLFTTRNKVRLGNYELKRKQAPSESINEFNLHLLDCKKELEELDYKLPEEDFIHIYRLTIHPEIHGKMKATMDKSLEDFFFISLPK